MEVRGYSGKLSDSLAYALSGGILTNFGVDIPQILIFMRNSNLTDGKW
jgi:hypothetical protein